MGGNFKITLNPWLIPDRHPLPLINEIFATLGGGERFSQIDLSHAYMQIPVKENSRDYLTIITHKGLFRYTKLPEGVASGPGAFQKNMENTLQNIPGTRAYLDNIYCTGKTDEDHLSSLIAVFTRLENRGYNINIEKCEFFKEKIEILGFALDKKGLHMSQEKIRAMVTVPIPANIKQLSSLLGLVIYYDRFLVKRAERLKPLYDLLKQKKLVWTKECQKAYDWLKEELVKPTILVHYNPNKKFILATDASQYGLSAILSHVFSDGTEKPIAYASKIIPESELNRAPIDKEAGAIIFGLKNFIIIYSVANLYCVLTISL